MENLVFTQLSVPEIRQLLRQELEDFYKSVEKSQKITQLSEELLTIKDASEFLNLSVATIYSKVSKGELPVMKRGKRLYFSNIELLNYIKEGRKKTIDEIDIKANNYLLKK